MHNTPVLKILFVINPIAGGQDKKPFLEELGYLSQVQGFLYQIYMTSGDGDKEKIATELSNWQPDIVAAVGGDGTCNLVASVLMDFPQVVLGIIPFGSANGLARELNLPVSREQAVELLLSGIPKAIDVVVINNRHLSLHLSDLGLNARIVKRFEESNQRGMWSYIKQFFRELRTSVPCRFMIDGKEFKMRVRAHMVAIANSTRYGTGAILNPNGKIDDGQFELCIIKPFPFLAMFAMLIHFFRGTIDRSSYVDIVPCSEAVIVAKKKLMLQVDGEYIGKLKRVEAHIKKAAIQVMVARNGPPEA